MNSRARRSLAANGGECNLPRTDPRPERSEAVGGKRWCGWGQSTRSNPACDLCFFRKADSLRFTFYPEMLQSFLIDLYVATSGPMRHPHLD